MPLAPISCSILVVSFDRQARRDPLSYSETHTGEQYVKDSGMMRLSDLLNACQYYALNLSGFFERTTV